MKKLNLDSLKDMGDKVVTQVQEVAEKVVEFIKKNKKTLIVLAVLYLAWRYLFGEDNEDSE